MAVYWASRKNSVTSVVYVDRQGPQNSKSGAGEMGKLSDWLSSCHVTFSWALVGFCDLSRDQQSRVVVILLKAMFFAEGKFCWRDARAKPVRCASTCCLLATYGVSRSVYGWSMDVMSPCGTDQEDT